MRYEIKLTSGVASTSGILTLAATQTNPIRFKFFVVKSGSAIVAGKYCNISIWRGTTDLNFTDCVYYFRPSVFNSWWGVWSEKEVDVELSEVCRLAFDCDGGFHAAPDTVTLEAFAETPMPTRLLGNNTTGVQ